MCTKSMFYAFSRFLIYLLLANGVNRSLHCIFYPEPSTPLELNLKQKSEKSAFTTEEIYFNDDPISFYGAFYISEFMAFIYRMRITYCQAQNLLSSTNAFYWLRFPAITPLLTFVASQPLLLLFYRRLHLSEIAFEIRYHQSYTEAI